MPAGIQDRLNLLNSKDFRQRLRRFQLDRPPPLTAPFGHMMQKRPVRGGHAVATPARLHRDQQPRQFNTMAGMEPAERRQRRQLSIHAARRAVRFHRRQHRHQAVPRFRRHAQPGDEPGHVLQPCRPPVDTVPTQIGQPVLQVVGIRLDRVRRLLDRRQIRQEPLDWLHRHLVITEHRPRLEACTRHQHALHPHSYLPFRDGQQKVIPSTTPNRGCPRYVVHVVDDADSATDNVRRNTSAGRRPPRRRGWPGSGCGSHRPAPARHRCERRSRRQR